MKKISVIIAALAMSMVVISCSDDDEDGVCVDVTFALQNEAGQESFCFKDGDAIIFDLLIANNSSHPVIYACSDTSGGIFGDFRIGEDLFQVYDAQGNLIGKPWESMFCEETLQKEWTIPANSVYHIRHPWYNLSETVDESVRPTHPLCLFNRQLVPVLNKGNYYTSFTIQYKPHPDKKRFSKKAFNIQFSVE